MSLNIYGLDGRLVRTLVAEQLSAGPHEVMWDGRDNRGRGVASGSYIYRIVAGSYTSTQKMVLTK